MKFGRWLWLLLPLALAAADPTLDRPGAGVLDPAEAVDHAQTRRLAEKVDRLAEQPGIALLIVFERGEEGNPTRAAQDVLDAWQTSAAKPATPEAANDAGGASASEPAEAVAELPKAVLSIRLATGEVDFAGSAELAAKWPEAARQEALAKWVTPPLAEQNLSGLVHGLVALCESLAGVEPEPAAVSPALEEAVAAPLEPPRPWLNGWLFVGWPVLVWVALLAARHGLGPALAAALPLALLYSGLYFLLAFRPPLLIVAGVLAFAPLWLMQAPVAPRRGAAGWQPGGSGFAQTGYGAFGSGAWSS